MDILRGEFSKYDLLKSGNVAAKDFKAVLSKFGVDKGASTVINKFKDSSNSVNYVEFIDYFAASKKRRSPATTANLQGDESVSKSKKAAAKNKLKSNDAILSWSDEIQTQESPRKSGVRKIIDISGENVAKKSNIVEMAPKQETSPIGISGSRKKAFGVLNEMSTVVHQSSSRRDSPTFRSDIFFAKEANPKRQGLLGNYFKTATSTMNPLSGDYSELKREVEIQNLKKKMDSTNEAQRTLFDRFSKFDTSGKGLVSRGEFKHMIKQIDIPLSEKQLDVVVNMFEQRGSGLVDYTQFIEKVSNYIPSKKFTQGLSHSEKFSNRTGKALNGRTMHTENRDEDLFPYHHRKINVSASFESITNPLSIKFQQEQLERDIHKREQLERKKQSEQSTAIISKLLNQNMREESVKRFFEKLDNEDEAQPSELKEAIRSLDLTLPEDQLNYVVDKCINPLTRKIDYTTVDKQLLSTPLSSIPIASVTHMGQVVGKTRDDVKEEEMFSSRRKRSNNFRQDTQSILDETEEALSDKRISNVVASGIEPLLEYQNVPRIETEQRSAHTTEEANYNEFMSSIGHSVSVNQFCDSEKPEQTTCRIQKPSDSLLDLLRDSSERIDHFVTSPRQLTPRYSRRHEDSGDIIGHRTPIRGLDDSRKPRSESYIVSHDIYGFGDDSKLKHGERINDTPKRYAHSPRENRNPILSSIEDNSVPKLFSVRKKNPSPKSVERTLFRTLKHREHVHDSRASHFEGGKIMVAESSPQRSMKRCSEQANTSSGKATILQQENSTNSITRTESTVRKRFCEPTSLKTDPIFKEVFNESKKEVVTKRKEEKNDIKSQIVSRLQSLTPDSRKAFRFLDKDVDGKVTIEDLQRTVRGMNLSVSKKEIREAFQLNDNSELDFQQFAKQFKPKENNTGYIGSDKDQKGLSCKIQNTPSKRESLVGTALQWESPRSITQEETSFRARSAPHSRSVSRRGHGDIISWRDSN